MKILFVTHYSDLYGANKSLLDLIDGLRKYDLFDCQVIVCGTKCGLFIDELIKRNIKFYKVLYTNDIFTENRKFEKFRNFVKKRLNKIAFKKLTKLLNSMDFDIVHTNSSITFLGFNLAKMMNIPHVWHIREFLYEAYNFKYIGGENQFLNKIDKTFFIAISQAIYDNQLDRVPVYKKEIIHDGLIVDDFVAKSRCFNLNDMIVFGIVGYISNTKNQKEALLAFIEYNKINKNSTLYIVGGGDKEYINALKAIIVESQITDKVFIKDFITDIYSFYDKIDVLLMCTRNEALGRVTIEAMSVGIPVIGYDNGGTSELIDDSINGYLYKGDYVSLLDKMQMINDDTITYLSDNAIKTSLKFTIGKSADKVFFLYKEQIINNK